LILNGKNRSANPLEETSLTLTGHRCVGSCNEVVEFNVEVENRTRYWNTSSDWPNNTIPGVDEDVHIEPGWNMVFDMGESPVYRLIRVNGNLTFLNTTN
jgi:hypothetical protein